jgi:formylglycine-generating enzyme
MFHGAKLESRQPSPIQMNQLSAPNIAIKSFLAAIILQVPTCLLHADNFGSGANQFTMDFVAITGGTNTDIPDASNLVRYGAVPYNYRMGKHEVSRAMITSYNALSGGPTITLDNMTSFGGNGVNRPATGVSWNEAARFVNWLNVSTGHSPAYKFTTTGANDNLVLWTVGEAGYDASNPFRNANARYFLPSEDEWYRAAYYNPVAAVYRDYPTGTDLPNAPTSVTSGTAANTAVYNLTISVGPADITQAGGLSPFGTMAQGGNAIEWIESAEIAPNDSPAEDRAVRGGTWYTDEFFLRPGRQGEATTTQSVAVGFRVASKTLPATVLKMLNPRKLPNSFVADIESNIGPVDVYRSIDLVNWGVAPISTNVAPGLNVVIDPAPPTDRAFYQITPPGAPPPGS